MVEDNFASQARAFQISTPAYEYWGKAHSLAADRLEFAFRSAILLTVFTGDIGSGKSTVVRKVVTKSQEQRLIGAFSYSPTFSVDPCFAILDAFGAEVNFADKESHRHTLQQSLLNVRTEFELPTVVVDDAHRITDQQLSNLFDLAGFNDDNRDALFKIILVGHPKLYERLNNDKSDLLGPSFVLEAMTKEDTAIYIEHRLKAAGCSKIPFTADALNSIFERTAGNPHQINLLCKAAINEATALGGIKIDADMIRECSVPSRIFVDV